MKIRHSRFVPVLIAAFVLSGSHGLVAATGSSDGGFARVPTSIKAAIGTVSLNMVSHTPFTIDGRRAVGDQLIWGGELIEVPHSASARIVIETVGHVSLGAGTAVKLGPVVSDDGKPMLRLWLYAGSVSVTLHPSATASVVSFDHGFTAATGATFRVAVRDRQPVLSTISGEVRSEQQTPAADVNIRIVDDLGRPVSSGSQFSVRARSTRQIQVQVTDKNDKPIPDLPVLFSLGNPCLGTLGIAGVAGAAVFQKKTDNRGIAAVILTAGAARCAGAIVARVEGTNAAVEFNAQVAEKKGFWNAKNTTLITLALAAAGVGIGFAIANANDDDEPVRQVPAPNPGGQR
jgi:hypothetical protein